MLAYRIFLWLYPLVARLISFANPKALLWVRGRKSIFKKLSTAFHLNKKPVIWMHCASLGEFEQGLPLLESIKIKYPDHLILVTFFSPSGYEIRKNHPVADHVFYLPMDSPAHAHRFYNIVQPVLVLFVKYEFWYYYLQEAKQRNIPAILVSGIFREDQVFFKWYGGWYRKMLRSFSKLYVQNQISAKLLARIGFTDTVEVTGDTRFDRVIQIAQQFHPIPAIDHFCRDYPVLVAGSTWTEDDEALDHFVNHHPAYRFLIAPHNIDEDRINECLNLYQHSIRFSVFEKNFKNGKALPENIHVLIIDNVGMLSRLYHYASICYVGGGFGDEGIHNILEAAVYGKPVVFGPVYDKFAEAEELLDCEGAFSIEDALELEDVLTELSDDQAMSRKASNASAKYVTNQSGATQRILDHIQANRLLTS